VLAVADQFVKGGADDLENVYIFQTPEVKDAGGIAALGLAGDAEAVIRDGLERIIAARKARLPSFKTTPSRWSTATTSRGARAGSSACCGCSSITP